MFYAIFNSDCPFRSYVRINKACHKSFVRMVSAIRYGVINYNVMQAYDFDDPRYIDFKYIHILDERNDLNEVAYMTFQQGDNYWLVTITEYDE